MIGPDAHAGDDQAAPPEVRHIGTAVLGYGGAEESEEIMTDHPHRPDAGDADDDTVPTGVEIGSSDGEGTTFEPEEDPDGHDEGAPESGQVS